MTDLKFTPPETFPAHYITRDGRKVELLRRIKRSDFYVFAGVMTQKDGSDQVAMWTETGRFLPHRTTAADLQDIPQRREVWVNVYPGGIIRRSCLSARTMAAGSCVRMTGQGFWARSQQPAT